MAERPCPASAVSRAVMHVWHTLQKGPRQFLVENAAYRKKKKKKSASGVKR